MDFTREIKLKELNGDFTNLDEMVKYALFKIVGRLEKTSDTISIFNNTQKIVYYSKSNGVFFIDIHYYNQVKNKYYLIDREMNKIFSDAAKILLEIIGFPSNDKLKIATIDRQTDRLQRLAQLLR